MATLQQNTVDDRTSTWTDEGERVDCGSEAATLQVSEPSTALVRQATKGPKPALSSMISVHNFEDVARQHFSRRAFAYYASAADDLISQRANFKSLRQLMLRPRVLRNVKEASIKRRILGCDSEAPFFVCPAAAAGLAHPEGERAIARACAKQGIVQGISSNATYPLDEIVGAGRNDQPFFLQLYVNADRRKTEAQLRSAKALGIKAVVVTVDAPVAGKREADERVPAEITASTSNGEEGRGLGRNMGAYIDPTLCWHDLPWLKRSAGVPVVLKGIQTAADARKAMEHQVDGILLSNHGGRSLDTVQPAILTLLELHKHCPEVFDAMEVFVDGGFSRGTDILKALALGATAVGIARPYLYSLAYGQEGVERLTGILKDELVTAMKLSGITNVDQAHPGMVNTAALEPLIRGEDRHPWILWQPRAKL